MAETEQQQKVLSLAEQWSLQFKDEQDNHSNTFEHETGKGYNAAVMAEKIAVERNDQAPVGEEIATRVNDDTPKQEVKLIEVEENYEAKDNFPILKENCVVPEQKSELPQAEEKHEPLENAYAVEVNSEIPAPETEQAQEVEDMEAKEEAPMIKLETAPADIRFPTTNQTRHCFTRYIEYHRCITAKGEGASECQNFAKYYRSLCPGEWIDRWNEQRENGTFPGPL